MDAWMNELGLVDLVSEKHQELRRVADERWAAEGSCAVSHAEGHLLARVAQGSVSIAALARLLNVSRQAAQQCARGLAERGFVSFERADGNAKEKRLALTSRGEAYRAESERMKERLEREIGARIGPDALAGLKELLRRKWV